MGRIGAGWVGWDAIDWVGFDLIFMDSVEFGWIWCDLIECGWILFDLVGFRMIWLNFVVECGRI